MTSEAMQELLSWLTLAALLIWILTWFVTRLRDQYRTRLERTVERTAMDLQVLLREESTPLTVREEWLLDEMVRNTNSLAPFGRRDLKARLREFRENHDIPDTPPIHMPAGIEARLRLCLDLYNTGESKDVALSVVLCEILDAMGAPDIPQPKHSTT